MLAVLNATNAIFNIVYILILIDVFASWIPFLYSNRTVAKILYMIHSLVDPLMKPVRKLMAKTPLAGMPVDFSPVIVLILLNILRNIIFTIFVMVL